MNATGSRWLTIRPRLLPLSFLVDRRVPLALVGIIAVSVVAAVSSIGTGEYPISPADVIRTLLHQPTANADYDFVVNTLRLPRVGVAFLVGMALATSGAIMQGLTRNPLASPGLTGVTAGANLMAIMLLVAFPTASRFSVPVAAFGGGLIVTVIIYMLSWRKGDSPIRMILIGIGLNAVIGAITSFMITFGEITLVQRAMVWLAGSVYARGWDELIPLALFVAVLLPIPLAMAPQLNAMGLGDDVARGIGVRLTLQRATLLFCSAGLVGAAVASAGAIGFVGLVGPHIARRLVGPAHAGLLPVSAFAGGMIVLVSDWIGRTIIAPSEIPCGVIVSILGAPFFIWLLWRSRNS